MFFEKSWYFWPRCFFDNWVLIRLYELNDIQIYIKYRGCPANIWLFQPIQIESQDFRGCKGRTQRRDFQYQDIQQYLVWLSSVLLSLELRLLSTNKRRDKQQRRSLRARIKVLIMPFSIAGSGYWRFDTPSAHISRGTSKPTRNRCLQWTSELRRLPRLLVHEGDGRHRHRKSTTLWNLFACILRFECAALSPSQFKELRKSSTGQSSAVVVPHRHTTGNIRRWSSFMESSICALSNDMRNEPTCLPQFHGLLQWICQDFALFGRDQYHESLAGDGPGWTIPRIIEKHPISKSKSQVCSTGHEVRIYAIPPYN